MRHIKKYGNRRLYDTHASAYVNMSELITLIQKGETIRVTDAKTEEDLTRTVLLQLLMEQQGARVLPTGLLHRLLRMSVETPMHAAAIEQMGLGLRMLDQQLDAAEAQWPWMRPTPPPAPASGPTPEPDDTGPEPEVDVEMTELRERLAALEERLRKG